MEEFETAPHPKEQHKKQTLWQIWLPLILAILAMLFLCVITVLFTARDVSGEFNTKWAGISIIYLAIPAFFEAFIVLLILAGLIYLASKLLHYTPIYSGKAYGIFLKVNSAIQDYSDKVTNPVITVKSKWSGFTTLFKRRSTRNW